MSGLVNIPKIPCDLSQEEMILRIGDVLEFLDGVSDSIFADLSNQIRDKKSELQGIEDRINTVSAKVAALKDSKKSTRLLSSATYPGNPYTNYFVNNSILLQNKHKKVLYLWVYLKHAQVARTPSLFISQYYRWWPNERQF